MHIVFFFYDTLISSEFDTTERLSDKRGQSLALARDDAIGGVKPKA